MMEMISPNLFHVPGSWAARDTPPSNSIDSAQSGTLLIRGFDEQGQPYRLLVCPCVPLRKSTRGRGNASRRKTPREQVDSVGTEPKLDCGCVRGFPASHTWHKARGGPLALAESPKSEYETSSGCRRRRSGAGGGPLCVASCPGIGVRFESVEPCK